MRLKSQFNATFLGIRISQLSLRSLTDGKSIIVQYTTPPNGRISINLITDEQNAPMHFNVRYDLPDFKNVVDVTSLKDNKFEWDKQEYPSFLMLVGTLKLSGSCQILPLLSFALEVL